MWINDLASKLIQGGSEAHTAILSGFFAVGNVMHWFHRLDGTYITFMGTLLGFALGHVATQSFFGGKNNNPPGTPGNGQ